MYEQHECEQYFFDKPTIERLTGFLERFENPCCLCAPLLGREMAELGLEVRILDIDERFASVPGFRKYDLYRPEWLGEAFDIIICDPPFFRVSLSQLFAAIRVLARYDFSQKIMVSYLTRRTNAVMGTFAPFGIRATGFNPGYQTVRKLERNEIQFFSNLPGLELKPLLTSPDATTAESGGYAAEDSGSQSLRLIACGQAPQKPYNECGRGERHSISWMAASPQPGHY